MLVIALVQLGVKKTASHNPSFEKVVKRDAPPNPPVNKIIKKTISLDPFVERVIRRHEAEMLKRGWRNANFSLSLNILALSFYSEHVGEEPEPIDADTFKLMTRWLDDKHALDDRDFQKWDKWISKLGESMSLD